MNTGTCDWFNKCFLLFVCISRFFSISFILYYVIFQKKLQEVSTKFRLFQKPANFEQRLRESKRILDEVSFDLPVLDMESVEQDAVQTQLDHCMVGLILIQ